jgi:hypothetical protein
VSTRSVGKSLLAHSAPPFAAENFLNLALFSHNEAGRFFLLLLIFEIKLNFMRSYAVVSLMPQFSWFRISET